jgi:hypothetical protein
MRSLSVVSSQVLSCFRTGMERRLWLGRLPALACCRHRQQTSVE